MFKRSIIYILLFVGYFAGPQAIFARVKQPDATSKKHNDHYWSEFYIGGQVGLNSFKADDDIIYHDGSEVTKLPHPEINKKLKTGGFYFGVNRYVNNKVLLGLEGDIALNVGTASSVVEYPNVKDKDESPYIRTSVKPRYLSSLRLRSGYDMGRFIPYVAAGIGYGNFIISTGFSNSLYPAMIKDTWLLGGNLAAGVDFKLNKDSLLRFEYRYSKYSKSYNTDKLSDFSHDFKYTGNEFRLGTAVKF